jgi:hypothetical protein
MAGAFIFIGKAQDLPQENLANVQPADIGPCVGNIIVWSQDMPISLYVFVKN